MPLRAVTISLPGANSPSSALVTVLKQQLAALDEVAGFRRGILRMLPPPLIGTDAVAATVPRPILE